MSESKQGRVPGEEEESLNTVNVEDTIEDEDPVAPESSTAKSKKKKKKNRLKALLSHKPNTDVTLEEVEETIGSTSTEEKKELSKEEKQKLEMVIRKLNKLLPGGGKDLADHKFWKTQPVPKFGTSFKVYANKR
jgi:hypothetical protein